jgi:cyclohexanecarboxyl-CoA dehydrogenase
MSYINLLASLNGQILATTAARCRGAVAARLTAGEALLAIALTEPRGGSDAANLRLKHRARRRPLRASTARRPRFRRPTRRMRPWSFARTGTVESGAHGVTALLVPDGRCRASRATLRLPWPARDRARLDLLRERARARLSHRLGEEGKGFVQVMQGFDFSRALIGLQVLAVARVALEETWAYVAERQAFGKPMSSFQGVSHPLADFDTQVEAARLLCLQALWLKDRGAPHSAEAAMCKWWAPKLAYDAIHQCLLMFGHGGYDRGPMEQRLRDVLGFQIGDGTAQIMKTIIARERAGTRGGAN